MNNVPNRRFQFRCCESNIENSTVFQNDPFLFANSRKNFPHSSVILSYIKESIVNGSVG